MMIESRNLLETPRNPDESKQGLKPFPSLPSERSPRFFYWFAFLLSSLIVAGSSIEASDRVQPTVKGIMNQKWAVGCSILSFSVAFLVVFIHLSPFLAFMFIGTKVEGALCFTLVALWSALVATISDSNNGLAVDREGAVILGNLYYSSWGGFVIAILLLLNFLKEVYFLNVNDQLTLRSDRLNAWLAYLIISIILTSSAANVFDCECLRSERFGTKFCNRSILAIVVGGAGSAGSLVIIGMKISTGLAPWGIELMVSSVLFITDCFAVGLVTSEVGPGAKIGNLFYFSWFSAILSFLILSATFDYVSKRNAQEEKDGPNYQMEVQNAAPVENLTAMNNPKSVYHPSSQSVAPTEHSEDAEDNLYMGEQPEYSRDEFRQSSLNHEDDVKSAAGSIYTERMDLNDQQSYSKISHDTSSVMNSISGSYSNRVNINQAQNSVYSDGSASSLYRPSKGLNDVYDNEDSYSYVSANSLRKPTKPLLTSDSRQDSFRSETSFGKQSIGHYDGGNSYTSGRSNQISAKGYGKSQDYSGDSYRSGMSFDKGADSDKDSVRSYGRFEESYTGGLSFQQPSVTKSKQWSGMLV